MYTYRIRKYIGQYAAAMGGVDIIVFTGGAGENQWEVREGATQGLEFMGVKMDEALNRSCRATEATSTLTTSALAFAALSAARYATYSLYEITTLVTERAMSETPVIKNNVGLLSMGSTSATTPAIATSEGRKKYHLGIDTLPRVNRR